MDPDPSKQLLLFASYVFVIIISFGHVLLKTCNKLFKTRSMHKCLHLHLFLLY